MGSSASTTGGLSANARAIATRCCCPPERSPGRCSTRSESPTSSRSCSARSLAWRPDTPLPRSGIWTFSDAVRLASRLNAWKTIPTWWRRYSVSARPERPTTWVVPTSTDPEVGERIPASTDSKVVLPQPLAPRSKISSPPLPVRSKCSIGRTVYPLLEYSMVRSSMARCAAPASTAAGAGAAGAGEVGAGSVIRTPARGRPRPPGAARPGWPARPPPPRPRSGPRRCPSRSRPAAGGPRGGPARTRSRPPPRRAR